MILLALSAALLPPVQKPPNWSPPEPKMFVGSFPMATLASGGVATALRLASGVFAAGWRPGFALEDDGRYALYGFRDTSMLERAPRPDQPLVLYEYEASPFCRKVREACSTLGLRVTMMPCPGARAGFAKALEDAGIILRRATILDHKKLGLSLTAIILIVVIIRIIILIRR